MKKHVKIYMDFFGYGEQDFIPDELEGTRASEIHHIDARGMGGSKGKDHIDNLMALSRKNHDKYGDKKQYKQWLYQKHQDFIKRHVENKS
jgi:hypothetical protein